MIVKGLIKSIDFADNSCKVRLPIFETAASSGEVVLKATILIQPGMYNGYAEGDVVFVDFENDKLSQPIVIGKLYLGAGKESEIPSHAALSVSNLNVTRSATLPIDTKLVLDDIGDTVPVESGITSYKSITDIIKALYKAESDVDQVTHDQLEMVSKIQVDYLSQEANLGMPSSDDPKWQAATPAYQDGFSIWQKTTCYNHSGQILNVEIICLTAVASSAVYRLRCSARMHMGSNQLESLQVIAMVKFGTDLEIEDTTATLSYKWSDGTEVSAETTVGSSLSLSPAQLQAKNLIITARHGTAVYDSETILYSPLNTPFIVLSNETDAIVYEADGTTVVSDPVSSKATLYLNGDVLPATYKWELTDLSAKTVVEDPTFDFDKVTTVNGDTVTVKRVNPRTRTGTAKCIATVTQNGSFKNKTYSKDFTVVQTRLGENATSFWLSSTCTVHTGQKHGKNIVVTAMKKVGISPEEPDTAAYIWWRYKNVADNPATTDVNESAWKLAAAKYRVNFTFPDEVIDDDILLLATHNYEFNPNATGVNLLTDVNIYEQEEIPFSPLNTPILNLTNDMGAFSCKSDGTKMDPDETTSTEAELWLNGSKLSSGVTYKWDLTDCATDTGKTGANAVTTPTLTIKTLSATVATAVCTATYKGESYSKTFKVIKQIQGQSLYIIDVYNDFVTIPTDENGNIFESIIDDLPTLTTHTLACYYGGENVPIADYVATTPTSNDTLFRIKYTLINVELAEDEAISAPNFAISNLTADEGLINYELYRGTMKLASAKFEATKLRQGVSATSQWVDYTSRIHRGVNQQSAITATSWEKFGNLAATIDLNRYIRYGWRQANGNFGSYTTPVAGTVTVAATSFKNADLIFELGTWDGTTFTLKDSEIISYSPMDTPILDLSNDNATLAYKPTGEKLGSGTVSSIASVYLNGEIITDGVSYSWSPTTGATTADVVENEKLVGNQITVSELSDSTVEFKCTATINNKTLFKNEITLEKVFTVTKQIQGEYSVAYWLQMSSDVHLGTNQQASITITAMQKVGTEAIEDVDESAKLYYKYASSYVWTEVTSPSYTLTMTPDSDEDLQIKAIHMDGDDEVVYETETITYSPLNTPALDLDNDSDAILYSADGETLLGGPVTSTATLYLNGDPLAANYNWTLINGLADAGDAASTSIGGATVTVAAIVGDTARAVCIATVTADGPFQGKTYTKIFTVSKLKKGDNAIGYSLVMDQQSLILDANSAQVTTVRLTGTCYVHDGNSVQPFGGATYKYSIDSGSYTFGTAGANGTISFEASSISTSVEVCLVVDGLVVDKEVIKTIPAGVSIVSQTTYYALVHDSYTSGTLKAPTSDADLAVKATDGTPLIRLDLATTPTEIAAARCWGPWSTIPPAHTENTNGWKYWTSIRTEFSSSTAGHYSNPIINEDLSGVYALAEGKTTNYYSAEDPSNSYSMKEGDCWFHTDEAVYDYIPRETTPTVGTEYVGCYITPDDNNPTTFIEVTSNNLQSLLDGDGLMTLLPGWTKAYDRSYIGTGGVLYQWVGTASSGYWTDIGDEIVANKVTANFINALKITAKKVKVLDEDNSTLFEADGLDGDHRVSIGGFEVKKNTLTTGDTGRNSSGHQIDGKTNSLIKLNSDSSNVYSMRTVASTEISKTTWPNSSWTKHYTTSSTNPFTKTVGLTSVPWDGKRIHDLVEYSVPNNLKEVVGSGSNNFYAVTKITFNEAVQNFTIYLNHTSNNSSDYMIASIPSPSTIPNSTTSTVAMGHTSGSSSTTTTALTYESISAGQFIYLVYVHGSSSHSASYGGFAYLPATNIRLSIGDKFQVLADGTVYAKNLYLLNDATSDTTDSLESVYGENASGRLEAAEAKIDEIETVKLAALEASIGSINTNKIEVKNTAKTKTIFKADGITTGLADDARVQIGGFTVGDSLIKSTNDNLQFNSDGTIIAKTGNIGGFTLASTGITSTNNNLQLLSTGTLIAKAGDIGGFEINPSGKKEGLYSDYLALNSEQVYFPVQAHLNLNDKVKIYTATPSGGSQTSYIATVNDTDFIIQNQSGAGIKFAKDGTTTNVDVKLTIASMSVSYKHEGKYTYVEWGVTNSSGDNNIYSVYLNYSITMSQPVPYPITCKLLIDWSRSMYFPKEPADYQKFKGTFPEISFTIPAYSTYNEFSNRVYEYCAAKAFSVSSIKLNGTAVKTDTPVSIAKYSNTNNSVYSLGHFLPNTTESCSLGSDKKVWSSLHIMKAEQYSSDRRLKNSIQALPAKLDMVYDKLKPVAYKFNAGVSDRQHFGFIAQDIQQSLADLSIDTKDFAPLCIPKEEDAYMSVRYTEFIPLNTDQIQKLKKRVADQEARIQELERAIKELKT